jgi:predicted transcriptional regulator
MKKMTIYLPDDLREALERVAVERAQSKAELVREAVRDLDASNCASEESTASEIGA